MNKQRELTIKHVVPNLRHRWDKELAGFSDNQIAAVYEEFGQSDEFGNNDAMFPEWFPMMHQHPKDPPQ